MQLAFEDCEDTWQVSARVVAGEDIEYVPGSVRFAENGSARITEWDRKLLDCMFDASSRYVGEKIEFYLLDQKEEALMERAVDYREELTRQDDFLPY